MSTMRFQVQSINSAGTYQVPGTDEPEQRVNVMLAQVTPTGGPAANLNLNLSRDEAQGYFPGDTYDLNLTPSEDPTAPQPATPAPAV